MFYNLRIQECILRVAFKFKTWATCWKKNRYVKELSFSMLFNTDLYEAPGSSNVLSLSQNVYVVLKYYRSLAVQNLNILWLNKKWLFDLMRSSITNIRKFIQFCSYDETLHVKEFILSTLLQKEFGISKLSAIY